MPFLDDGLARQSHSRLRAGGDRELSSCPDYCSPPQLCYPCDSTKKPSGEGENGFDRPLPLKDSVAIVKRAGVSRLDLRQRTAMLGAWLTIS